MIGYSRALITIGYVGLSLLIAVAVRASAMAGTSDPVAIASATSTDAAGAPADAAEPVSDGGIVLIPPTDVGSNSDAATASTFTTVQIQGNANLNAGNIGGTGSGSSEANSSIGVYAETNSGFSIIAAFSFGSKGTSFAAKTVSDYVSFLEQPSSTLGGQVKLQYSWLYRDRPWLRYGLAINSRVFSANMNFGDNGANQRINLVALDPSVALAAQLDAKRKLSVIAELGLATRFWSRPGNAFTSALNITRSQAFAGPRVAAAISIGDIYAGVEMTRYFGGRRIGVAP